MTALLAYYEVIINPSTLQCRTPTRKYAEGTQSIFNTVVNISFSDFPSRPRAHRSSSGTPRS